MWEFVSSLHSMENLIGKISDNCRFSSVTLEVWKKQKTNLGLLTALLSQGDYQFATCIDALTQYTTLLSSCSLSSRFLIVLNFTLWIMWNCEWQLPQIASSNIHMDHYYFKISAVYYVQSRTTEGECGAGHNFKWCRFHISLHDLHSSLVTLFLSLLSKATNIRGKANMGQGQSLALTEHKCITNGLNYQGITRRVVTCHCASHNRFKQVENVFRREE